MSKFKYTVRKDGRLAKKLTIDGKTIYLCSNDPIDLEKQYIEAKYKSNNGLLNESGITLKEFTKKWIELNSVGKEYRTIQDYNYIINSYIIPNLGFKKIKNIKIYDVKSVLKNLEDKPRTAKKTLQLIKRILNDAVDNDLIIKNVAQNLKAPKVIKKERKPLSKSEDKLLLKSKHKYSSFFILMRYTGMRREEIVPLTKQDINLDKKIIKIDKAVTFIHNQPVLKGTKNDKTRFVPILDVIFDMLKNLVDNSKTDLLFTKETDNNMLTESAIKRHLESFLIYLNKNSSSKIYFTCHQLRHSYCTMLYYSGIKIKEAQELMGHSSADMVYNIYTHLDQEQQGTNLLINNYVNNTYIKRTLKLKKVQRKKLAKRLAN